MKHSAVKDKAVASKVKTAQPDPVVWRVVPPWVCNIDMDSEQRLWEFLSEIAELGGECPDIATCMTEALDDWLEDRAPSYIEEAQKGAKLHCRVKKIMQITPDDSKLLSGLHIKW